MKTLGKLLIVGAVGWLAWSALSTQGPGDRPSLLVSNGPVRIELQPDKTGLGELRKGLFGMGRSWYHHHQGHGPTHLEVIVTGSSCGADAKYDGTEVVVVSGGGGTSSTVTLSIWGAGPFQYLEIDPANGTALERPSFTPDQLVIGVRDEQLQSVRVANSTCAFVPGEGSILINQRH